MSHLVREDSVYEMASGSCENPNSVASSGDTDGNDTHGCDRGTDAIISSAVTVRIIDESDGNLLAAGLPDRDMTCDDESLGSSNTAYVAEIDEQQKRSNISDVEHRKQLNASDVEPIKPSNGSDVGQQIQSNVSDVEQRKLSNVSNDTLSKVPTNVERRKQTDVSDVDDRKPWKVSEVEETKWPTISDETLTSVSDFEYTHDVICSSSQNQRHDRILRDNDLTENKLNFPGRRRGNTTSSDGNCYSSSSQYIEVEDFLVPSTSQSR